MDVFIYVHYAIALSGIIVGLAIGLSCIVICTLFIICRRRCIKHQVPEPEAETGRHTNGNGCHRDRQVGAESYEMEYFTHLSSQSGANENAEATPQHVDTKVRFRGELKNAYFFLT